MAAVPLNRTTWRTRRSSPKASPGRCATMPHLRRPIRRFKKALERGRERHHGADGRQAAVGRTQGQGCSRLRLCRGRLGATLRRDRAGELQPCGTYPFGRGLHGSSRPVGMSELRFMSGFDETDAEGKGAPDQNYIELHPLGRVENCYRWAGETDVFEAIAAACRNYHIDRIGSSCAACRWAIGDVASWFEIPGSLRRARSLLRLRRYASLLRDGVAEFCEGRPVAVVSGKDPAHARLHRLRGQRGRDSAVACIGDTDIFRPTS